MILIAKHIQDEQNTVPVITPWVREKTKHECGASFGLSEAGYDIRVKHEINLAPGQFMIASSVEKFKVPTDLLLLVKDKSTWARKGLSVFNTVIEPGWEGWLTLELKNQHHEDHIHIPAGGPIAQILFNKLSGHARAYDGKYQGQQDEPVEALLDSGQGTDQTQFNFNQEKN